ncbi:hypothetical protein [Bowmanella yangjiangensis]|uniref:Phage abortive infection protein n=1 Tax=Bowmanella yangjiangensis TaxID=2811230 RepID=A0ABS3CTZ7_9ALTE|nr:hypothetical protein [Bowmanella yangjiangensis]MBN7820535.1 hypothetical protein [Bowmanella yangjiangensis]
MKEERSIFRLKLFWFAVAVPAVVSLVSFWCIFKHTDLIPDPSSAGWNNFIEIFKFPIGALAAAIPLTALVAANHRSKQTAESLRRNSINQSFSNYFKHREEFFKLLEQLSNEHGIEFYESSRFYKNLFPTNSVHYVDPVSRIILEPNNSLLNFQAKKLNEIMELTEKYDVNEKTVQDFYTELFLISTALNFTVKEGINISFLGHERFKNMKEFNVAYTIDSPLKHCYILSSVIISLADFCHVNLEQFVGMYMSPEFKEKAYEVLNPSII